jgi:hypothetical protein
MSARYADQAITHAFMRGGFGLDVVHANGQYSLWGGAAYTHRAGVYEPMPGREWARLTVFPGGLDGLSLRDSDEYSGLLQVDLRYPPDVGVIPVRSKADEIQQRFGVGQRINYAGVVVTMGGMTRTAGELVDGWFSVVQRINFRSFLQRGNEQWL